ncbi:hypothetical protein ACU635_06350 [[Actinomadura] parvosata]|uniref:hypothetical protein n=1 Tax=[Actinomadura] parvosata TaxID=1955412 RepID=UPI00406C37DD
MLRFVAILAATTPSFLSFLLPGRSCGWFAYEVPEPSLTEIVVWEAAGLATAFLPVVLALLALWAPRWFRPAGAFAAAAALVLKTLTTIVPYTSPCGEVRGEWEVPLCHAVALTALLLTRAEPPAPRLRAAFWSGVLLLAVGQSHLLTEAAGCRPELKGTWALAHYHLLNAETAQVWIALATIGAVLAGHRVAPFLGLAFLVPALFQPAAWYLSGAAHDCSSILELVGWPYLLAGVLALCSRLPRQAQ